LPTPDWFEDPPRATPNDSITLSEEERQGERSPSRLGGSSVAKMTANATLNRVICARPSGLSGSGASGHCRHPRRLAGDRLI